MHLTACWRGTTPRTLRQQFKMGHWLLCEIHTHAFQFFLQIMTIFSLSCCNSCIIWDIGVDLRITKGFGKLPTAQTLYVHTKIDE